MKKKAFKNGTLKSKAYFMNGETKQEVEEAVYEGETPLSAENLNEMQDNIEEEINKKQDKRILFSNMMRNSNYLIAKATKGVAFSRMSIFVDNATNYNKTAPTIFNINSGNTIDKFKLYKPESNEEYLTKIKIYEDSECRYIILTTGNYCDYVTAEIISQNGYTLIKNEMTKDEFNDFITDKTLISETENKNIIGITTGTEYETGRIIDGKKEYGKRINCGNMPDTSTISISTGLGNVTYTDYKGVVTFNQYCYKMDDRKINEYSVTLTIENNQIKITTYRDSYTEHVGYVEIFYTKN